MTIEISTYRGYRHNRYDGYNCTWGVLMALGASPTADAFAEEDDYPDDDFNRTYQGEDQEIGTGENDTFRQEVLGNLDAALDEVIALEPGESTELVEYWGEYRISIKISREANGRMMCVFDGYGPFEVVIG